MGHFLKCSGLVYFIWFAFFTKSEKDIDRLMKDKKLLDEKIKNITDVLASIKDGFHSRLGSTERASLIETPLQTERSPTIAEKIYFIPLGKVQLRKFIIDMTVDMNYLKNTMTNQSHSVGNLKATADVNAKLFEDEISDRTLSKPVKKKDKSGHFEYFSPMFKVNLKALPVGVQLFIPIHKITSIYQMQRRNISVSQPNRP